MEKGGRKIRSEAGDIHLIGNVKRDKGESLGRVVDHRCVLLKYWVPRLPGPAKKHHNGTPMKSHD
ncbi:hypothetical protein DSLASN_31520 [Desulfoluna limicola]|uniref:Uncharacterized protein n=1 Tax=Desulfoluna limicola TaxID=2810562 RepID=A0ABM7PIW2_9BACT|nr:hypothetical protein DSLASN_31520 [Desulfoluna limicola]